MNELKVVNYIKNNSLNKLIDDFSIKATRHREYNNLVQLKYNQIDTPKNEMTDECRGIILNEDKNYEVVCYGYKRFYNYGENRAAKVDFKSCKVFEKLDGSLMQLYFYNGEWHVASSGVPDATGEIMGTETTFAELFWKVFDKLDYTLKYADKNCCYMFELMTQYNRVIVQHKEPRLVLHGARRLSDFRELNPVVVSHVNGWECVGVLPLDSWDDILEAANKLNPMEAEGYVVCDAEYNRVKVKSPQYVAMAHMREGFTTRRMLEIVRTNEQSEFLTYFPEYAELYHEIRAKFEHFVGTIEGYYDAIKHIDDRKQFALVAKDKKFSGILFGLKFNKIESVRNGLSNVNIKHLSEWLGVRSVEL